MIAKSLLFLIAIFALTGTIVSAETNTSTESTKNRFKTEKSKTLENRKSTLVQRVTITKERNQDIRTLIQSRKDELTLEKKRVRDEFKTKIAELKDGNKKLIAEDVDQKLNAINLASTDRMTSGIGKLEKLLDKFSSRSARIKSLGNDTSTVDSAIASAESAIADAKIAVTEQAAKEYTVDITDETTLRSDFGKTMKTLRADLKATHDILKLAKQRVIDVARALAKLKPDSSITGSPTVAPTNEPQVTLPITPIVTPSI
jgi:hypothetical protein